jgi:predicted nucleic acid-binding protein
LPILDTVVLFGTADSKDKHHEQARKHLRRISEPEMYLGAFALFEFDVTLKSRGFSFEQRMETHALLLGDYPDLDRKVSRLTPSVLYVTSRLEEELHLEYFDAGIAAEALQLDGSIVSTDKAFDRVEGLTRSW